MNRPQQRAMPTHAATERDGEGRVVSDLPLSLSAGSSWLVAIDGSERSLN